MKRCYKCGNTGKDVSAHHINGNHGDNRLPNLISLCTKCHDLVQGICDKCRIQGDCFRNCFIECWMFEEALPPIHFRLRQDDAVENENITAINVDGRGDQDVTKSTEKPIKIKQFHRKRESLTKSAMYVTCGRCGQKMRINKSKICEKCKVIIRFGCPCQSLICPIINERVSFCHKRGGVR